MKRILCKAIREGTDALFSGIHTGGILPPHNSRIKYINKNKNF